MDRRATALTAGRIAQRGHGGDGEPRRAHAARLDALGPQRPLRLRRQRHRGVDQTLDGLGSGAGIDAIGGTITAGIVYVLVVWLAAGFIRTTPLVEPNRWVADSTVIAAIDRTIPYSSQTALGGLAEGLNATGFPQVFSGQPEQIRG